MRKIPNSYVTKREKASYIAGYRAGFDGRESQPELRHKDLQPIYLDGWAQGTADRQQRAASKL